MALKYIFSINSGRSGSDYLTEILSQATNAVSIHEGFPILNGTPMQNFNEGDDTKLRALIPLKMKQIHKKTKNGLKIYCETNHSYIKGWGYIIPDEYIPQEEIGVIILRRDVDQTAYSLLRIHNVPGTSEANQTWYLAPNAPLNFSKPIIDAGLYDLCKWYVEEINLRAEDYKRRFPKITYLECDLEQLNDYHFVIEMFKDLGLHPSVDLKEICGRSLNRRNEWPKLPLEKLLKLAPYPRTDDLAPADRDTLLQEMIVYLHTHQRAMIAAMEPDYTLGGSLVMAATHIIAVTEEELEENFHCSLKYSEMESLLILELTRSVSPQDFIFVFVSRVSSPNISYRFNFNLVPDIQTVIAKLGLTAILNILKVMLKGMWGRDYSHRTAKSQRE